MQLLSHPGPAATGEPDDNEWKLRRPGQEVLNVGQYRARPLQAPTREGEAPVIEQAHRSLGVNPALLFRDPQTLALMPGIGSGILKGLFDRLSRRVPVTDAEGLLALLRVSRSERDNTGLTWLKLQHASKRENRIQHIAD